MEIETIVSIGVIILILFLVYRKPTMAEHFSFGSSISKATKSISKGAKKAADSAAKGTKKAVKTVGKAAKPATKAVAKAAKPATKAITKTAKDATKAVTKTAKSMTKSSKSGSGSGSKEVVDITNTTLLNNIDSTKGLTNDTQKIIDRTIKTSDSVNKSISGLSSKIEQLNARIKFASQKKIFTLYLIRKTAAKIAYLNGLISVIPSFNSGSTKSKKQIEILKRKIYTQIYAVKIYVIRTNSYICQTTNLFAQINFNYIDVIDTNNELKNQINRLNTMITDTNRTVNTTNEKITNVNNQITEATTPQPVPEEQSASEEGNTAEASSEDATATESETDSATESEETEGFENVSLIDPLNFSLEPVVFPTNIVIPSIIPTLVVNELVAPQFVEPKLDILFPKTSAPSPAPSFTSQSDADLLFDLQAESELEIFLPKEENVIIPADADPVDIDAENQIIYELRTNI